MRCARFAFLALAIFATGPAWSAATQDAGADRYRDCLAKLDRNPDVALDDAEAWTEEGGGGPARHCAALALVKLGRTAEAARRFTELAKEPDASDTALRAELYAQAGNAWLLARNPNAAYGAFSQALALTPDDTDMRFDRARAAVVAQDFSAARSDLDAVLTAHPNATDALILRASTRREQGDLDGAARDADQAVMLAPNAPEAWLERGLVHSVRNQRQAAVADWRQVVTMSPQSDAADAARRLIEEDALRKVPPP